MTGTLAVSPMALHQRPLLALLGLAHLAHLVLPAPGCPSRCRCYSLTVECGSMGLREIPAHVPPATQTIFLQDNAIGQIRVADLSRLGQLHYLYLQNNSISALEPGAFRSQGQLLELALNRNRIHLVSANVFQGLEHLRILYLAGNQITRLQDYTFRGLQRLQELHLQENSVEMLGEQALAGLSSLALLDLSRNNLRTLRQASLRPLVSLQVLRVTENPWRCDCALHWLRGWIGGEGQRLLSSAERRLLCAEPPRLAHRSLAEVPANSLVCIPPVVRLEPRRLAVRLGENLRVSCHASGYPQPQVTWRKASRGKAPPGAAEEAAAGGGAGVTSRPGAGAGSSGGGEGEGERSDPDTGSGMLFLSNVTAAHAGPYECEAWNPGGVARVTFHLSVNASSSPSSSSSSSSASRPRLRLPYPAGADVSREPLYTLGSMDFDALGTATQTAIAAGIALLALTALLLLAMIYGRHRQRKKGPQEEGVLYVNDYSDGPTTFAQLEEYRDARGHEMYVLNRGAPVLPASGQPGALPSPPPGGPARDQAARTLRRGAGDGGEAEPEALFLNQGLLFDTQIAYEIHC
ncbi:hypothetical protein MATL_G00032970 [Megalops atlanticus]|uniref:Ig-like domain-containing protein n=1 Tax=Megalops atlanticus TaxID=7932 RepID=A0A9D3TK87_MEGAT|nr:hypothetical protein MATL_G00032970 [Megalops atlanticus]